MNSNDYNLQDTDVINPFQQPKFKNPFIFKSIAFGIFLLRFPFFILFLFVFMIYLLFLSLIPKSKVTHIIIRMFSYFFYKGFCFFTGTLSVSIQPTPLVDTYRDAMPFVKPKAGDLIISNLGSFLNLLFIQGSFSPIYIIPYDEKTVLKKNFIVLLIDHLFSRDFRKGGQKCNLSEIIENARTKHFCPVCIFPECAPANGSCILQFVPFGIGQTLEDTNVSVIGFLNSAIGISADISIGTGTFWYLIQMFGRLFGTMKVRTALPQDVPKIPEDGIDEKWLKDVRTLLALIMRVPLSTYSYKQYLTYIPQRKYGKQHAD